MILKSELERAYALQQAVLRKDSSITSRLSLGRIKLNSKQIQVISGVRRCGKSTLMRQLISMHKKEVAYFNFEDPRVYGFDQSDFQKLDEIIGEGKAAYFFDEIQNAPAWEIFVRHLHDRGEKVFITGSNASLLSRELGTRLTGRHIRHELFPFSFVEYISHKKLKVNEETFKRYLQEGGFPEFLDDGNQEILQNLLKDIVLRDIAVRYGIKNTKTLMDIVLFLVSNVGKEVTFNSLKKTFSMGAANTVSDYLSWLEDSYVLFLVPKFSWSVKNRSVNPRKVYAIDTGFILANSLSFTEDRGRLLENAIYLFLRQNNFSIYYYREKSECDFVVVQDNTCKMLIQVCEEVHRDNLDREVKGLWEAMDFFKMKEGFIVTQNQADTLTEHGRKIELVPAFKFMSQPIDEKN